MSEYSWIAYMLRKEKFNIPPKLEWFLRSSDEAISPYVLLPEDGGIRQLASMQQRLPGVNFMPFVRRQDDDVVIGVVLDGAGYQRGQVLSVFDDVTTPPLVEEVYPSLDAWANAAWNEIASRLKPSTSQ